MRDPLVRIPHNAVVVHLTLGCIVGVTAPQGIDVHVIDDAGADSVSHDCPRPDIPCPIGDAEPHAHEIHSGDLPGTRAYARVPTLVRAVRFACTEFEHLERSAGVWSKETQENVRRAAAVCGALLKEISG